jgi:signal recognition particle GTPase
MVLAELGGRISAALQSMTNATVIDEAVLKECLKEIASALLQVWNIQLAYVIVLSIVVAPRSLFIFLRYSSCKNPFGTTIFD